MHRTIVTALLLVWIYSVPTSVISYNWRLWRELWKIWDLRGQQLIYFQSLILQIVPEAPKGVISEYRARMKDGNNHIAECGPPTSLTKSIIGVKIQQVGCSSCMQLIQVSSLKFHRIPGAPRNDPLSIARCGYKYSLCVPFFQKRKPN